MSLATSNTLSDLPKEKEYEEFISAYFQAGGYYIERNIIDRDVEEILELDIIAYDYRSKTPFVSLVEIKSGGWGFSDVFKIRGWLDYTNISQAILVCQNARQNFEYFRRKAAELEVDIILNSQIPYTAQNLSNYINPNDIQQVDIEAWRYSYWTERQMLKILNRKKKAIPNVQRYKVLEDYYFKVNCGLFFTRNIIDRLEELYDAFRENPRISAKTANELIGRSFNEDVRNVNAAIFKKTYYEYEFNDIQISTYIEHFARLSILKNLIDYILYKREGKSARIEDTYTFGFASKIDFLPQSLKSAMKTLENDEYLHLYPVFWQWFIYVFGGFILLDFEDKEYEILSDRIKIPIDHIQRAFEAYEIIFPMDRGWFKKIPNSNIKILKMFPVPFRSIGAYYRKLIYTPGQRGFAELGKSLSGLHTLNDLINWNNHGYELLKKQA